jgi:hypothetical protein
MCPHAAWLLARQDCRSVARRSLNHVNLAKAERLYKRTIYPPLAIQDRTDICAINAIMIRKSDLASLAVNCGSQQMNDLVFVKHKSVAAQIAARSNRTSFAIGPASPCKSEDINPTDYYWR